MYYKTSLDEVTANLHFAKPWASFGLKTKMKNKNGWFNRACRLARKTFGVVCVGVALAGGVQVASASTDPTTIYTGVDTDFQAAIAIAIGAIGIGAAIMYIRKGLKARM